MVVSNLLRGDIESEAATEFEIDFSTRFGGAFVDLIGVVFRVWC